MFLPFEAPLIPPYPARDEADQERYLREWAAFTAEMQRREQRHAVLFVTHVAGFVGFLIVLTCAAFG
jgi:hypothetical protein